MLVLLVCVILLSTTEVRGRYEYLSKTNGWITVHKVAAKWEDAVQQCNSEGAILMSPIREELRNALVQNIYDTEHFIGTKMFFNTTIFVSLEGVPLHDMPVDDMYSQLDPQDDACLSMQQNRIKVVSCLSRLPYICYKEEKNDLVLTQCNTFDMAYKLNNSTGSCYKFHEILKTWTGAYSTCVAEGGYLAIVNDDNEAQELVKITYNNDYYVFIGLRDRIGYGDWQSVHGEGIKQIYNHWEDSALSKTECCAVGAINPHTGQLKSFMVPETETFFICEKDPKYVMFLSL